MKGKTNKSAIKQQRNQIAIPSSQSFLPKVDEYLERRLRRAGFDKNLVVDIAIAVTEAVNNAIQHGNHSDPRKSVTIRLALNPDLIAIEVEDQGKGFDPARLPNPLERQNLLKEAGRGLFIVRSLMDEVSFEKRPTGMLVRLVKFLHSRK